MADTGVGLADAIESLRAELVAAMERGRGRAMQFGLAPIELNVQVVVTKEGRGQIGWKILEAEGSYAKEATQSIKLVLNPFAVDGDGVARSDFRIAENTTDEPNFGDRA